METGHVGANGIKLFYVAEGEGPLVLMCHGFPESWFSWRHQIPAIAEAGFHAVAIDMPGFGRSDKPDVHYDVVWLSECLADAITALGHERAVMVGHDWGGLLVWPFARLYPERTAGVIGLNTPDIPRLPMPPLELYAMMGDKYSYILQFQEKPQMEQRVEADVDGFIKRFFTNIAVRTEVFTDEVLETYIANFRSPGAITPPLEYYRNMNRNWELTEGLDERSIDVPCLMISAAGDPVLTPELTTGMEDRIADLEKVVIEDCGHWTQQEQPEKTNELITSFLTRRIST